MRKKLIVLFSVLMLLSTALFAFNVMPMGASAAISPASWTVDFDDLVPTTGGTKTITTAISTGDENVTFGNLKTANGTVVAYNTAIDGTYARLTSNIDTGWAGVWGRFTQTFKPGTYYVTIVMRKSADYTSSTKDGIDFKFYDSGYKNIFADYDSASADAQGFKRVSFSIKQTAETTDSYQMLIYMTTGSYVDIKSISVTTEKASVVDFDALANNTTIGSTVVTVPGKFNAVAAGYKQLKNMATNTSTMTVVNGAKTDDAYLRINVTNGATNFQALQIQAPNGYIAGNSKAYVSITLRLNDFVFQSAQSGNMQVRIRNSSNSVCCDASIYDLYVNAIPDANGFRTINTTINVTGNAGIFWFFTYGASGSIDVKEVKVSLASPNVITYDGHSSVLTEDGGFYTVTTTQIDSLCVWNGYNMTPIQVGLEGTNYFARISDASAYGTMRHIVNLNGGDYVLRMKVRPSSNYKAAYAYLQFWNTATIDTYRPAAGDIGRVDLVSLFNGLPKGTWTEVEIPFNLIPGVKATCLDIHSNASANIDFDDLEVIEIDSSKKTILGYEGIYGVDSLVPANEVEATGSKIALTEFGIGTPANTTIHLEEVAGYDYTTAGTHKVKVTVVPNDGYIFVFGTTAYTRGVYSYTKEVDVTITPGVNTVISNYTLTKAINFAGLIDANDTEYVIATNVNNNKFNADGYNMGSWSGNSGVRVVFDNGVPVLNMYENLYDYCQMYIYNVNDATFTSGSVMMAIKVKKFATSGSFVNAANFDLRTYSGSWTTFADFTTELNSAPVGEWVTLLVPITMPSINNFMLRYIPGDANSQIYVEYLGFVNEDSSIETYGTGHDVELFADLTNNAITSVNGIASNGYSYDANLKTLTLKGSALDALTNSTEITFTLQKGKMILTVNPVAKAVVFTADGKVVNALSSTADGYTLPSAKSELGYRFVGWYGNINGTEVLLPANATLTVGGDKIGALTESIVLDAVFANIDTLAGARIKLDQGKTGLRFETALSFTKEILEIDGVSYNMRTLLAPRDYVENIDNVRNFTGGTVEDANPGVATTFLIAKNGTLQSNGVYYGNFTNILPYNYARQICARGYINVTYTDGSTANVYANFDLAENSRSVYEVAKAAFLDRDGDPAYDTEDFATIKSFIDGVVDITYEAESGTVAVVDPIVDAGEAVYAPSYTATVNDGVITLSGNGWSFYTLFNGEYYRKAVIINGVRISPTNNDFSIPASMVSKESEIVNTINITTVASVQQLYYVTGAFTDVNSDSGINTVVCNRTGVAGTDLGIPCYNESTGKMHLFFGDTFNALNYNNEGDNKGFKGFSVWNSNVMAVSSDFNLSDGLEFEGFLSNGKISATTASTPVIQGLHDKDGVGEVTKIPTGAIDVNGTMYMFYFSMHNWKATDGHQMNYGACMKSTDEGLTWSRVWALGWADHSTTDANSSGLKGEALMNIMGYGQTAHVDAHVGYHFTSMFPVDGKDGYIYFFAQGDYRTDDIYMARVLKGNIENFDAYEYFCGKEAGQSVWVKYANGAMNKVKPIIEDSAGEVSAMYNDYLGKWVVTYLKTSGQTGIVMRTSKTIDGIYSDPTLLISHSDAVNTNNGYGFEFLRDSTVSGSRSIYSSWVHERWTEDNGKVFYMVFSQYANCYNSSIVKVTLG